MLVIVWAVPSLKSTEFTVMQIVTSYLFIPYEVKEHGNAYPVLYVGWTLTYEMLLRWSLRYPILFSERRMRWALPGFFVVLSLLSLARPTPFLFRFLTDPLLLEFILGCLFAWLNLSGYRLSKLAAAALGCGRRHRILRIDARFLHGASGCLCRNPCCTAGFWGGILGSQ
ncbi:hypothetical protein [Cupriavidus sp. CP313]